MPKQTFLNLPEDKRKKILASARKEFSRVSLHEASISNIIKDADIPRGSFYQYFEDKEDVFFLVLKDYKNININKLLELLKDTKGDLVEAFIQLFEYFLQSFKCEENKNFFRNAFLNMSHKMEQSLTPGLKKRYKENKIKEAVELIDLSRLNINHEDDVKIIFKMLMTLTMSNIVDSFAKHLSFEESIEIYKKQIGFLKKGIYNKDSID